ncbi:protein transport protein SEC16A homolog [Macadamia integrifolia]|uniref:protein transport protein SEC16A homolog n=1 Tax=Macadamia integrifolia TaxID=60698 RepID=UPI001C4F8DB8|nr:protein transport protein SEC16A homolog [Macadamia integrifolia]
MASPPFQVEDQTDEDFFDKLVDDEIAVTESGPGLADGEDSDEVKAFSNLSIGEVGTALEGSSGEGGIAGKEEKHSEAGIVSSADAPEKDVSSNSFAFENAIETNDVVEGADVASDSTTRKSSGSRGTSVKEVQWSAFHTDAAQQSGSGFGSYSDFFTVLGDKSGDPFEKVQDNPIADSKVTSTTAAGTAADLTSVNPVQYQEGETYGKASEEISSWQNSYDSQYWENLYPGWKYDPSTGEWHQVDGYDATVNNQVGFESNANAIGGDVVSDQRSEVSYLQQTTQSVAGTMAEGCTTGTVSNWNQVSQGSTEYPPHMVFDSHYPGWYYDTIAQEWRLLESYTQAAQSTSTDSFHQNQNENPSTGSFLPDKDHNLHGNYGSQVQHGNDQVQDWAGSPNYYSEQNMNVWQPELAVKNESVASVTGNQQAESFYGSAGPVNNYTAQQNVNVWQPQAVAQSEPVASVTGNQQAGSFYGSAGPVNNYTAQQNMNVWQPEAVSKSESVASFTGNKQTGSLYGSSGPVNNNTAQHMGFESAGAIPLFEQTNQNYDSTNGVVGFRSFVPSENSSHQINQKQMEQSQQVLFSNDYYGSQKSNFIQQPFHTSTQNSYIPHEERSSAGRPPHSLVTFGFGGKLIVMKESSSFATNSAYGSQDSIGGSVSLLNLSEVVMENINSTTAGVGACDYFRTLCQQSFPGPLVGGNAGSKELNKWIDERIAYCESPNMDYRKGELLRLLLSLLKIACQHYGKFRSPFGTDPAMKESDCPEAAVAQLFASARRSLQSSHYGALTHCLQTMPSEGQIRATAVEVQNLLVSGRTKEALQCAQEGQLWGPALVLASQLGDQFYVDTVKQMAHHQLIAGTPLRTLCLLIAGQPADVFSTDSGTNNGAPQIGSNSMLDDWEENLAIITANPTKGDELVIIHLGDCLWKERGEISAAHTCYLVADANFESYSDTARLCLIGADHWKYPRTYASPEAIQRTELYEYSKVLGNSQSILLPFQPYKLIYAHMLAEMGKVSDSLKYCQAILKSLKTGRAPEVETWKQLVSSLEERIRTHQQGGYSTNLAPAKLVGKLLPFIDKSIHRMIGAPPPPVQSTSQSSVQNKEHDHPPFGTRVLNSQSTMAMSSLMPSVSMEPISEWKGDNRMMMSNRSISEPDFGRTPRQVDPSKEGTSPHARGKASVSGGPSRFGRFGSQLFQKTMGWVAKSRSDKQAKLGEQNKFYYDEKLKRWVEEGSEPPAEEAALPPPPPTASFQNGMSDYNIKNALKSESLPANGGPEFKSPTQERGPGIPPIPPGSNQFSARGRMGVRSRYVDTFNKGGGTVVNSFQSASVPAAKPAAGASAKFFIPTPIASGVQTDNAIEDNHGTVATNDEPSTSVASESSIPSLPSPPMQRFPSMGDITPTNTGMGATENGNGSLSYRSRRTASWGGISNTFDPPKTTEIKPLGETLGMPPSMFMPSDPSQMRMAMNGVSLADDLQEVEL